MKNLPRPLAAFSRLRLSASLAVAGLALVACASTTPPPNGEIEASNAAIAAATGAGGMEWAPSEMRSAQEKLNRAKQAVTDRDNDRAVTLARESLADARLAEAKANSAKARKSATELAESNRVLNEEVQRKSVR